MTPRSGSGYITAALKLSQNVHKSFSIKSLGRISIVGVGLLGGSIGLALRAAGFTGVRVGVGRRSVSLERALEADAVDEVTRDVAAGVSEADLVILCTPISRIEPLLAGMADALRPGTHLTDVASTKVEVVRLARQLLPATVHFVGSHPMAGSEKTGVEFARADLFDRALCLVTPLPETPKPVVRWVRDFWESLGGLTQVMDPDRHDQMLARVSHLPHAVATALVHLSLDEKAIDLAGPGFADATRIASGDADLWTDIFRTNRRALQESTDRLIAELTRFRERLSADDERALRAWLDEGKRARDRWVSRRYRKKVLPP